jgi:hypothetical protein
MNLNTSTSQKACEADLDAGIKDMESVRRCCDGGCNARQGRGDCPSRHITPEQVREQWSEVEPQASFYAPSPKAWRICDSIVTAICLGCVAAAIISATGVLR